ncbi:hypothetical protein [Enterobacter roggenkampii]|uniref:hypothetical protein n=1 Tax=Enterobacter roggenkampii TaxID=1812935 RepID=UPI002A826946|nr:hypothetical protein [Enterobacter roggenkampii]
MLENFLERIKSMGYNVSIKENGNIFIRLDCCPQWLFVLQNYYPDKYFPYFYYRMRRVEEVTDLHEVIPSVLAAITKSFGNSSFRFLQEENGFSGVEDELYAMYWFPGQPLNEQIRKNKEQDFDCLFAILMDLYMFHKYQGDILGVCAIDYQDYSFDSPKLNVWVNKIRSFIGDNESYVANKRINPNWFYFRSITSGVSVTYSPHIAQRLKTLASATNEVTFVDGVGARIEIVKDIQTTISYEREKFVKQLLKSLDDNSDLKVITQENQLVFISDCHLVFTYGDYGVGSVYFEKQQILHRQQREISILFGDLNFKWNIKDRHSSAEFEDLILELLDREPWVLTVKKVAPTNQGDNGRDLICEYNMRYNELGMTEGENSFKVGKMIIQCKTNLKDSKKNSIGKSDVDIANTIFDYRPDGYMLIVNTQITRDLTEMLERQKDRKEQDRILWWNAYDVEDRLRKHPDIHARYRHIVDYV